MANTKGTKSRSMGKTSEKNTGTRGRLPKAVATKKRKSTRGRTAAA